MKEEISLREARERSGLSLREASKRLNISHAYLSGLELGHKPLLAAREESIRKLYKIKASIQLVQPVPQDKQEFVTWLREQVKWWDSRFVLPTIPAVSREVSSLYVHPSFMTTSGRYVASEELLTQFFAEKENRALLVQGSVGSGKSFFMRRLALDTEEVCRSLKVSSKYVPILISLGQFQSSQSSFLGSVVDYYMASGFPGSRLQLEQFFRQVFERGNALVLLDGLDEISSHSQRSRTFAILQSQFETFLRPAGNRLIITARSSAFIDRDRSYDGFELVKMDGWDSSQIYDAVRKWSFEKEADSKAFLQLLHGNDTIYNLAKWPLLFHLLTTLFSASGRTPFQGRAMLCDACCQVLENTWDTARRSLSRGSGPEDAEDPLESHPWLKWRHFLIYFMQQVLVDSLDNNRPLPKTFSSTLFQDLWEKFLVDKGVERKSLDFARLEDLIQYQDRIGPILHRRKIVENESGSQVVEELSYLDPTFCRYYYAKALVDMPEKLDLFVTRFLRHPEWGDVVPLVIEELGRSERSAENKIADELVKKVRACDDELLLESEHRIGWFGAVCAARSVVPLHLDLYWKDCIVPVLEMCLNTAFEWEAQEAHSVFGEHIASNKMRQFFLDLQHDIREENYSNYHEYNEYRWRVLEALGKFGEQTDEIVDVLSADFEKIISQKQMPSDIDSILVRRQSISIRQIGRVFVLNDLDGGTPEHNRRLKVIQDSLVRYVAFVTQQLHQEDLQQSSNPSRVWDSLAAVLLTLESFRYYSPLTEALDQIFGLLEKKGRHFLESTETRSTLLQFFKACAAHLPSLPDDKRQKFYELLRNFREMVAEEDEGLKATLDFHMEDQASFESDAEELLAIFTQAAKEHYEPAWELGEAANQLQRVAHQVPVEYVPRLTQAVLGALQREREAPEEVRESVRIFCPCTENYLFPVYDHLYKALVAISRRMPLSFVETSGEQHYMWTANS